MKAPWFPFYTGDFLASTDVQLMEAHEVGAYVLLLAHSWQSDTPGHLPNDPARLRRLCRLSVEQWKDSGDLLLSKWPECPVNPALRGNPRLLKEAGRQVEMRELKAEAGRKSAERRALISTERQQKVNTIPTPVEINPTGVGKMVNYSQPQPQPQPQEDKSSFKEAAYAALPEEKKEHFKVEVLPAEECNALTIAAHTGGGGELALVPTARPKFTAPSADQVLAYMVQHRPHNATADVERVAAKCFGYYASNGWKVGRNPMKDWNAACQTFLADLPRASASGTGPVPAFGVSQVSKRQALSDGLHAKYAEIKRLHDLDLEQ